MPITLNDIVAHKRAELATRTVGFLPEELSTDLEPGSFAFERTLAGTSVKVIAEIKPASPSAGVLQKEVNIHAILKEYHRFASALSVLTDEKFFHGSLNLLNDVVRNTKLPVLRKDFVLDPLQVYEARLAGAEAVLLIAKILTDAELATLSGLTRQLGMSAVIEVQTQAELERALRLRPRVVLINNRNLDTFEISFETTRHLAPLIPKDTITISASGIQSRSDIEELLPFCTRFLVGTALMQTTTLSQTLEELTSI